MAYDTTIDMAPTGSERSGPALLAALTPTQLRVLHGVQSGLLNKQIAYNLGIAEATVKAHMTALMRKLNVRNRTQVAIIAQAAAATRGFSIEAMAA